MRKILLEPSGMLNHRRRCDQKEEQTGDVCLQDEISIISIIGHRRHRFWVTEPFLGRHGPTQFRSLSDCFPGESQSATAAFESVQGEGSACRAPIKRVNCWQTGQFGADKVRIIVVAAGRIVMAWRRNRPNTQVIKT